MSFLTEEHIRDAFSLFDCDNTGVIAVDELKMCVRSLGLRKIADKQFRKMLLTMPLGEDVPADAHWEDVSDMEESEEEDSETRSEEDESKLPLTLTYNEFYRFVRNYQGKHYCAEEEIDRMFKHFCKAKEKYERKLHADQKREAELRDPEALPAAREPPAGNAGLGGKLGGVASGPRAGETSRRPEGQKKFASFERTVSKESSSRNSSKSDAITVADFLTIAQNTGAFLPTGDAEADERSRGMLSKKFMRLVAYAERMRKCEANKEKQSDNWILEASEVFDPEMTANPENFKPEILEKRHGNNLSICTREVTGSSLQGQRDRGIYGVHKDEWHTIACSQIRKNKVRPSEQQLCSAQNCRA